MLNDKVEGREPTWRGLFPWTELFRGFQVALDLNKLLLAAGGILVTAFGWWLLALIFGAFYRDKPDWPGKYITNAGGEANTQLAWEAFRRDREQWNLMHETANVGGGPQVVEVADVAADPGEYAKLEPLKPDVEKLREQQRDYTWLTRKDVKVDPAWVDLNTKLQQMVADKKLTQERADVLAASLGTLKRGGALATWPWFENRGPNPFLLATGQAHIPREPGRLWDWFFRDELLVMLEPLVKLVSPIVYFFKPGAEGLPRLYFFLVFVWSVATWSVFGGAITRIAAVQVARNEKIGLAEAVQFTLKRVVSYLTAPLFPVGFIFVLVVFAILFGLVHLIPFVGDLFDGLLWVIPLVLGLLIAVTLVGLIVGWPLMSPTISAEGTDSWEAVSRSFSYVFQKPFHYLWYALVAIAYGAILVFFVGFMGSFAVYLSKWAVAQTPFVVSANREPSYLFVYAPESFGWRTLLLSGAKTDGGVNVVEDGVINRAALASYTRTDENHFHWWNHAAAGLMAFWLGLVFLFIIGFGYSYFWSAVTIIYMLLRKVADGAEIDEVYLEEDEQEGAFGAPPAPAAAPSVPPKTTEPLTMVEPPALRTAPAPVSVTTTPDTTPPPETSPVPGGDGDKPVP